jgi:CDP-paratose 2-epimerase
MREHYPQWDISISLNDTIGQIVKNWQTREGAG